MAFNQDHKVDVLKSLSVFHCILNHGEKLRDGQYAYSGVRAAHDADGYSLSLSDNDVRLDLYFHNKYQVQYEKRSQLDDFLDKVDLIYRKHG